MSIQLYDISLKIILVVIKNIIIKIIIKFTNYTFSDLNICIIYIFFLIC